MCLLCISSCPDSVKKFELLSTSSKLCKILLSSIAVIRELLLIWFSINLSVSIWMKSQNGFSTFHNSQIASIKFYANCFKWFLFRFSITLIFDCTLISIRKWIFKVWQKFCLIIVHVAMRHNVLLSHEMLLKSVWLQ